MTQSILARLKTGVLQFQTGTYANNAAEYIRVASNPQRPHTLVIACADSRVDIEALTSAGPGDLFIARNIGNMVPSYGEMLGGVSAVIEYAVAALGVQHAVICGHSDCGAMKALLDPGSTDAMPTVRSWLRNGEAALHVAASQDRPEEGRLERLRRLTEANVLMQMTHLKTHPSVAGALARGALQISGWMYDIGSGDVFVAEDGARVFDKVEPEAASSGLGE